jgi:agmatinase
METANQFQIGCDMLLSVEGAGPDDMVRLVERTYFRNEAFTLMLGGTHAVTIGAMQALSKRYDPQTVTVLHIDAHADLRNDDSDYNAIDPSPYAHSCVMRRVRELGFRIVSVGIRAYSREERDYAEREGIQWFEWGTGIRHTLDDVLGSIETRNVYLSVDSDGFDPSVMPATGTPVPGGVSWDFGVNLILRVGQRHRIIGADIVEVAPMEDSVLTEYAAAQIGYHIIGLALKW